MSGSPSTKRHKRYPTSRRYYISDLPDDVLSHILSRLPLKDAVRTCVLSKDWEFKWTCIYNVDIDADEFSLESSKEETFVNILERVVLHFQNLTNFRLSCSCRGSYGLSRIGSVISAILRRNIKNLEVKIYENEEFVLPRSLLNCASLEELDLLFDSPCSFRVPVTNCFPNLKILSLEKVKFENESSITDTLLFTFPVLKKLKLLECIWLKVKFVEIYAPSLCIVTSLAPSPCEGGDKNEFNYSINLIGAKIDELFTGGSYQETIIMTRSTVASANLEYVFDDTLSTKECGLQVRKLLRGLSSVKYLCINDALKVIGETKLGLPLPRFNELRELDLYTIDSEGLLELLHAAPYLKSLFISLFQEVDDYDYDSEPLPFCVVNHLEKVYFSYSDFTNATFLVEKFMLKNGAHLKNVVVSSFSEQTVNRTYEKLSAFPRASSFFTIRKNVIVPENN